METKGSSLIVQQVTLHFSAQEVHNITRLMCRRRWDSDCQQHTKQQCKLHERNGNVNTNEQGDTDFEGPVEDQFDFSMEYDIVIRWAITNSTCQQAKQNNSNYACRSTNSSCLHVTHGGIFMGYRCNCSSGFQGNPYIQGGCKSTSLSSISSSVRLQSITSLIPKMECILVGSHALTEL